MEQIKVAESMQKDLFGKEFSWAFQVCKEHSANTVCTTIQGMKAVQWVKACSVLSVSSNSVGPGSMPILSVQWYHQSLATLCNTAIFVASVHAPMTNQ